MGYIFFMCNYCILTQWAAKIDVHADKAVENNKWWGNDKGYYFTNTKNATTSLLNKEDGDDVYYKENTNEFVVVSTDGYIRTYFNPDSGKKYFDRQ